MFGVGFRTPAKGSRASVDSSSPPGASRKDAKVEASSSEALVETGNIAKVRRSIGEWETLKPGSVSNPKKSPGIQAKVGLGKPQTKVALSQGGTARGTMMTVTADSLGQETLKPRSRVAEAKACLIKAKLQINSSRNLKAEIKTEVILAVETLYRLVKEAEAAKPPTSPPVGVSSTVQPTDQDMREALVGHGRLLQKNIDLTAEMLTKLEQQGERVAEAALGVGAVKDQISNLKSCIDQGKVLDGISYAAVAASGHHPTTRPQAVHSVVVSSADVLDTSEDVLTKIRTAVSARTSGIRVDRVRKAKDQKVVLGCQSREELTKIKEKLKADSPTLLVKEVENRDPLVILFGVLSVNTDAEILSALKRQNDHILGSIPEVDYRASVKFRRKARNTLENHVVLQVSPRVWQSLTAEGRLHLDLQRVVVKDQSPLVTCSRCLGYGHGRKTCPESVDACSHCAGSHLRSACPAWQAGETPTCCNCQSARLDRTDHNSFDGVCPVRKKWDALARSKVAYC